MKKRVLVTNDDGFDSYFLRVLVDALRADFEVTVVAPAGEQSWIGRAISRRDAVRVVADDSFGCPGWRVSGTPTDCVNIALDHLLGERPDLVASGINVGFNTTVPLLLSSGTVAGALEGAFSGIPSIAFSKIVPKENFEEVRRQDGRVHGAFEKSLLAAARRGAGLALERLDARDPVGQVWNVNFPLGVTARTEVRTTVPAPMRMRGLFEAAEAGTFQFRYQPGELPDDRPGTDIHALENGWISLSKVDFGRLGER